MTDAGPLRLWDETVIPEWVDYNGHMNVAYYVLVFDHGTDAFLERIDMTAERRARDGSSVFVAEAHVTYERELMQGDRVYVTSQVLDHDEKRLHLFHRMHRADDGAQAASNELMILHVDLNTRRVAPFPVAVQTEIAAVAGAQSGLPRPDGAGRVISIKRR